MRIIYFSFLLATLTLQGNIDKVKELPCSKWRIIPVLYNNYISDTTQVDYWENYWYYKSDINPKFIPDTLIIELNLSPSMSIIGQEKVASEICYIKSTLNFKYGLHDNSNNVIDPHISDTIILVNQKVDIENIYKEMVESKSMGKSFYPKEIAIKELMSELNVWLNDKEWDFKNKGKPYALNQIIINSYFLDINKKVLCRFEFTLMVNGDYKNPNNGSWQF